VCILRSSPPGDLGTLNSDSASFFAICRERAWENGAVVKRCLAPDRPRPDASLPSWTRPSSRAYSHRAAFVGLRIERLRRGPASRPPKPKTDTRNEAQVACGWGLFQAVTVRPFLFSRRVVMAESRDGVNRDFVRPRARRVDGTVRDLDPDRPSARVDGLAGQGPRRRDRMAAETRPGGLQRKRRRGQLGGTARGRGAITFSGGTARLSCGDSLAQALKALQSPRAGGGGAA